MSSETTNWIADCGHGVWSRSVVRDEDGRTYCPACAGAALGDANIEVLEIKAQLDEAQIALDAANARVKALEEDAWHVAGTPDYQMPKSMKLVWVTWSFGEVELLHNHYGTWSVATTRGHVLAWKECRPPTPYKEAAND